MIFVALDVHSGNGSPALDVLKEEGHIRRAAGPQALIAFLASKEDRACGVLTAVSTRWFFATATHIGPIFEPFRVASKQDEFVLGQPRFVSTSSFGEEGVCDPRFVPTATDTHTITLTEGRSSLLRIVCVRRWRMTPLSRSRRLRRRRPRGRAALRKGRRLSRYLRRRQEFPSRRSRRQQVWRRRPKRVFPTRLRRHRNLLLHRPPHPP